jgi:hypothetical protein
MKKLIAFGLLAATVAFSGAAFAGDGGTLQDWELQKLFEWSAQVAKPASPVAAALEYQGSGIN